MTDKQSNDVLLMQYRLKTARRKKRLVKEAHEKMLRTLYWHRQNISNQIRNLGWEELHPPYQRGWKRTFIVKPEIARSKRVTFFEGLLQKINTVHHSVRKDFKKKKRIRRKRVYVARKQELRKVHEYEMKKFTEAELIHFTKTIFYCACSKKFETRFVLTEPNRFFKLKVMPNMITKVRKRDILLESSLAEMDARIERNNLEPTMFKLLHGSYGWSWYITEKNKYENPLQNKSLTRIMDEYYYTENDINSIF